MPVFRSDSTVVLLRKIVELSGCQTDCCTHQSEQLLLYLWAECVCGACGGSGPTPPPGDNLLLLENTDPFELEDGSGGIIVEV